MGLSANVAEVGVMDGVLAKQPGKVDSGGLDFPLAVQEAHDLGKTFHAEDVDVLNHRGFGAVGAGQDQAFQPLAPHGGRDGQRAADRLDGAVQGKLPHQQVVGEAGWLDGALSRHDSHGHGQIVAGPFLLDVRGCEVDGDPLRRERVTAVPQGRAHAHLALAHGAVGQTHHGQLRETRRDIDFHRHLERVDTVKRRAVGP